MTSERSLFLHLIRAVCAFLVCLNHAKEFILIDRQSSDNLVSLSLRVFLSLGSQSVLVFFFISGFLVGGRELQNLRFGTLNPSKYFFDRLTRLWLVIIPALFITYICNYLTCERIGFYEYCIDSKSLNFQSMSPIESQGIKDLIVNLFFLQSFLGPEWGSNGPLWSLSFEFWYYMVFYSFLILLWKMHGRVLRWTYVAIAVLIIIGGFYLLNLRWLNLGLVWFVGALAGGYTKELTHFRILSASRFLPHIVLIFAILIFPTMIFNKLMPNSLSLFPIMGAMFLGIYAMNPERNVVIGPFRIIIGLSNISFSLYAIHFPLLALLTAAVGSSQGLPLNFFNWLLVVLFSLVCVFFSFLFALVTELRLGKVRQFLRSQF